MDPGQPIRIFNYMTQEERGESARQVFIVGAIAISDLVKTTMGPKGMDKILVGTAHGGMEAITMTNDGATILKAIHADNPAAKLMVDVSKAQDDEVGDGTTSVCVTTGELLREGEKLLAQKVHPQTIIAGWRLASAAARQALLASAKDHSTDSEKFKVDLINIAKTTLSSKVLGTSTVKDHFAKLAVDAVLRLKGSTNLEMIHIIKKAGGALQDSFLDDGFILEKKIGVGQPKRLENAKILVANTAMDNDKVKIFGSVVKVDSTEQLAQIEKAERDRMIEKCKKIVAHGINCFINRQLIYNLPEQFFSDHGVVSIEHADFEGIERLALVTDGEITSTFDHPDKVKLGTCKLIEEIMIGEDKAIRFSGVPRGEACTVVLRGATKQLLDEAERSLHDALCVLSQAVANEKRIVFGGGCSEMLMAKAVDEVATKTPGKKALAVEAFARALRQIPAIIADNGGYDSSELVQQLRAAHYEGKSTSGLDMNLGVIGDMEALGITESLKVKLEVITRASEAAEMVLRIDEIVKLPPRQRQQDPRLG